MLKARVGNRLIVGITNDNVTQLLADNPLHIDLREVGPGIDSVYVVAGPSLRELAQKLADAGLLPQRVVDEWQEPQPGEAFRRRV